MSKKVLIFTYYWPPAGGVAVQRFLKFSKFLPEFGWEPIIVTVNNGSYPYYDESLLKEVSPGLKVYRTKTFEPFELYNLLRGQKGKTMPLVTVGANKNKTFFQKLSEYIRANYFVPDARKGWVSYAAKQAEEILQNEKIDAIITTGPPHSAHLIGLALKQKHKIKWIADFRDPWTGIVYNEMLPRTEATKKADKDFETAVLKTADCTVVISPGMKEQFEDRAKKIEVIFNGYDEANFSDTTDQNIANTTSQDFTIRYIGNLMASQNPTNLWKAIAELRKTGIDKIKLEFTGRVDAEIQTSITVAGLNDIVVYNPFTSQQEAINLTRNASLLLFAIFNLPNSKLVITGKIFEYLASCREIISFGPTDGDAAAILNIVGRKPMIAFNDYAETLNQLQSAYTYWAKTENRLLTRTINLNSLADVINVLHWRVYWIIYQLVNNHTNSRFSSYFPVILQLQAIGWLVSFMRYTAQVRFIFSLLLTGLVCLANAQVAFNNFTTKEGLPSNEIYSTFQDHDGFLWFGTDHGLVKYNGYSFKTYTTSDGLTDNIILDIRGDEENNIWFLTLSGGVCYFDGKHFSPHPNNDTIKQLFLKEFPTSWEIERTKTLWMGFVNMGFAKVDINKVTLFTSKDPAPYKSDSVHLYILKLNDNKYVYTSLMSQRLQKINDSDITRFDNYTLSFDFSGTNFNLLLLANKQIIISKEEDLAFIDTLKNIRQFLRPRNNPVLKLRQISDGSIWLLQRNSASYSIKISKHKIEHLDSLTFLTNATDLLVDRQGNEWLTTLDQGIYMIPNHKVRIFTQFKLPGSYKLSCLNSNEKNLFVGLPEGNILEIDRQLQYKNFYAGPVEKWPTAVANITFKINGEPEPNIDQQFTWRNGLNSYHTRILQYDKKSFLVGSSNGFALLSTDKKILFGSNESGFNKRITEICKLTQHKYLIGTLNGLYYFETDSSYKINAELDIKDVRITSCKSLNGQIFGVATRGNGIYLNIKNRFYNVTEKQGIISNLAEDLYFENDSVLWIASFKGVSKIYFKANIDSIITRIKNYTREDGLCSNQINVIMGFNGFIWLATNEGLCYFNPDDLPETTTLLPLYFDNISVNGTKRKESNLVLNHDENNIFIEFNALYYKAVQGIRYKVRLKNQSSWKYTDLNSIQYFSLPPGNYQFEVAAEDADGKYRSDIHSLSFVIKPRFIDTLLFKVLIAILVLIAVALVVSSIFSYQKLKATNVIKLLQAEFKALSYQINPHFIFNVLNSIQYYILKKDTDNAVHLLGSFALLIRRIVNNSRQQYIGIIEEVECLKEYMDLEKMRLDNKFEYTIDIDSSIDIEDKNILPMIIQPLVENSIWHGLVPSAKPGVITINFKKENGTVVCKVEDNGVGINKTVTKEKNQNNLSLAMKNVSERLKIISELNDTTWAIKTEDKSSIDPLQTGTIVTIIFPAIKTNT